MKQLFVMLAAMAVAAATYSPAVAADADPAVPLCHAAQMSLTTDDARGAFAGMNHSGTSIVLTNLSTEACRLGAFADVGLEDASGNAIKLEIDRPSPIPVVPPLLLAGGAVATAEARWVSGPVFDPGVCVDAESLAVRIGDDTLRAPLAAHLCGPDLDHIALELRRLAIET